MYDRQIHKATGIHYPCPSPSSPSHPPRTIAAANAASACKRGPIREGTDPHDNIFLSQQYHKPDIEFVNNSNNIHFLLDDRRHGFRREPALERLARQSQDSSDEPQKRKQRSNFALRFTVQRNWDMKDQDTDSRTNDRNETRRHGQSSTVTIIDAGP